MVNKFKPGDAVIVNEYDRPCSRLVAIVVEVDQTGAAYCSYANPKIRSAYIDKETQSVKLIMTYKATLVQDFGVDLEIDTIALATGESPYKVIQSPLPCIAKYSDGKPRRWDE
jgi:hypothetical protein